MTLTLKKEWIPPPKYTTIAVTSLSYLTPLTAYAQITDTDGMVDAALEMITDLSTISGAAFNVVLLPFGAMTAIKMLSMVLARV